MMAGEALKCVRSFITKRYWQKLSTLMRNPPTRKTGPIGCLLIVSSQSKFTIIQLSREACTDFTLPRRLANECHMHFQPYVGLRG